MTNFYDDFKKKQEMQKSLTIAQVYESKNEMNQKITDAINEFNEKTGLKVIEVTIMRPDFGDTTNVRAYAEVKI